MENKDIINAAESAMNEGVKNLIDLSRKNMSTDEKVDFDYKELKHFIDAIVFSMNEEQREKFHKFLIDA